MDSEKNEDCYPTLTLAELEAIARAEYEREQALVKQLSAEEQKIYYEGVEHMLKKMSS